LSIPRKKKEAMMQKENVSHEKTKDGVDGEEKTYPAFVIQSRCIERESFVVRCQCRWKEKKRDEEAKKKQQGLTGKMLFFCRQSRSWNFRLAVGGGGNFLECVGLKNV
jgi:hypothetical protein